MIISDFHEGSIKLIGCPVDDEMFILIIIIILWSLNSYQPFCHLSEHVLHISQVFRINSTFSELTKLKLKWTRIRIKN